VGAPRAGRRLHEVAHGGERLADRARLARLLVAPFLRGLALILALRPALQILPPLTESAEDAGLATPGLGEPEHVGRDSGADRLPAESRRTQELRRRAAREVQRDDLQKEEKVADGRETSKRPGEGRGPGNPRFFEGLLERGAVGLERAGGEDDLLGGATPPHRLERLAHGHQDLRRLSLSVTEGESRLWRRIGPRRLVVEGGNVGSSLVAGIVDRLGKWRPAREELDGVALGERRDGRARPDGQQGGHPWAGIQGAHEVQVDADQLVGAVQENRSATIAEIAGVGQRGASQRRVVSPAHVGAALQRGPVAAVDLRERAIFRLLRAARSLFRVDPGLPQILERRAQPAQCTRPALHEAGARVRRQLSQRAPKHGVEQPRGDDARRLVTGVLQDPVGQAAEVQYLEPEPGPSHLGEPSLHVTREPRVRNDDEGPRHALARV